MKLKARSSIILSSTLLVGMLLGALVHAHFFDNRVKRVNRMSTLEGFVASYMETIQPSSPEQEEVIQGILAASALEVQESFRANHEQLRVRIDSMCQKLEPILSEEQMARVIERRDRRRRD